MRVYIVDDSNVFVAKLINLFHEYDNVEVAGYSGNYADAVKGIAANEFDLALVDIRFPGGNGIDLINFIRYSHPSAEIAMLSNYSAQQFKKKCKERGANYFFDKTMDIDKAVKIVSGRSIGKNGLEGI